LGFKVLGYVVGIICGLLGMVIDFAIVSEIAGFWGVVVGIMFLPAVFHCSSLVCSGSRGNLIPLTITYVGGGIAALFVYIGSKIAGD